LAEQGARVTGIDINKDILAVAKDRCRVYGLVVELMVSNGVDISDLFEAEAFDFIIFFACLEHMTIEERLTSLSKAWEMLPIGGLLVIVETPNRLWYCDNHTSWMPLFHWLPNELAFYYSKFSSRNNFKEFYREYDEVSKEQFLRRGRGASFHEFDIAIKPAKNLKVISSLSAYQRTQGKGQKPKIEQSFKTLLMNICPDIHEGFFDENLYLIIEKD